MNKNNFFLKAYFKGIVKCSDIIFPFSLSCFFNMNTKVALRDVMTSWVDSFLAPCVEKTVSVLLVSS